jgi:Arc/MetJ-type ribon-helix-helix transcriptional regulator
MSVQVPTRFRDEEVQVIDALIHEGLAESRSELIRLAVSRLAGEHRRRMIGEAMAEAYRQQPQSEEEDRWALADAFALTAEEPW